MTVDTLHVDRDTLVSVAEPRHRARRVLAWVKGGWVALTATGWAGLQVEPDPLPQTGLVAGAIETVALPEGLPAPVARFYRELYGDRLPVVASAVISGRGRLRIAGVSFPARFRFSHVAGQAYRHYIELTAFGRSVMSVNERFLDGHGVLELPVGVSAGSNVDQGANLALWAEAVWMPSLWVTDARASWQPIDGTAARLTVPFGDASETFTVHFDPTTGLLERMESRRFKGADDEAKTLWINQASEWRVLDGHPAPSRATVTWGDERSPWADFRTEQILYNASLGDYIGQRGP